MEKNEIYDLKYTLAEYILPRLQAFKKKIDNKEILSVPNFEDEEFFSNKNFSYEEKEKYWGKLLEDMVFSFEFCLYPEKFDNMNTEEVNEKYREGLLVFARYFDDLWI